MNTNSVFFSIYKVKTIKTLFLIKVYIYRDIEREGNREIVYREELQKKVS